MLYSLLSAKNNMCMMIFYFIGKINHTFYNTKHLTPLLIIASMNKNGFIREQAIKRFNKYQNPKAIQYVLFRLGDWVKPVRETAKITLDSFYNN